MKYILKIESYEGDTTLRNQETFKEDGDDVKSDTTLYAVVEVGGNGAYIYDDGYRSVEEAKCMFPEAVVPTEED